MEVKSNLKKGLNYPSSLSKSLDVKLESNDILGVAYIKAINEINPKIEVRVIKRTNSFNDLDSNDNVVSASNIREKIKNGITIDKFIPVYNSRFINRIDEDKMFELLRYRILTDAHLEKFLGVDEGLENKLKKVILDVNSCEELIENIKSKRYTTSRLKRMLIHILLGIEKTDMENEQTRYKVLGFNSFGREYLSTLENEKFVYKSDNEIEKVAAMIYYDLTGDESIYEEFLNKPIIKE